MEKDLFNFFFPPQLFEHFDVEKVAEYPIPDTKRFELHIHLTVKNILSEGQEASEWESKGFTESKNIQDFPLRGKMV